MKPNSKHNAIDYESDLLVNQNQWSLVPQEVTIISLFFTDTEKLETVATASHPHTYY